MGPSDVQLTVSFVATLRNEGRSLSIGRIRSFLRPFFCNDFSLSFGSYHLGLFPDRWNVPLHACSYGERTKISFLRYVLEAVDVLLFDEPTNHLDLPSREALARALLSYDGTVVFATHDESFVRDVATDVYRIEQGSIRLTDDPFGDE